MTPESKVYIAGPMSIVPDGNTAAFMAAQAFLESAGILRENIFNPAISEESLKVEQGLINGPEAYRICLKADLSWICDHATVIYMLKGWEFSPGANAEFNLAKALKLEILYE